MTKEQFAEMLNGKQYRSEMTSDDGELAKDNGLVVVFGASDDLMKFRGAIDDEVDCYEGGTAYLDSEGLFKDECSDDCSHMLRERATCKTIEAIWFDPEGVAWTYETEIPHETFVIMEGDEICCRGIVFEMASLQ